MIIINKDVRFNKKISRPLDCEFLTGYCSSQEKLIIFCLHLQEGQVDVYGIMDVLSQILLGRYNRYRPFHSGLIVIILPFAFAYVMEMQKELLKIQGSNFADM